MGVGVGVPGVVVGADVVGCGVLVVGVLVVGVLVVGVLVGGVEDGVGVVDRDVVDGAAVVLVEVVEIVDVLDEPEVDGAPVCLAGWHAVAKTSSAGTSNARTSHVDRTSRRGIVRTALTPGHHSCWGINSTCWGPIPIVRALTRRTMAESPMAAYAHPFRKAIPGRP